MMNELILLLVFFQEEDMHNLESEGIMKRFDNVFVAIIPVMMILIYGIVFPPTDDIIRGKINIVSCIIMGLLYMGLICTLIYLFFWKRNKVDRLYVYSGLILIILSFLIYFFIHRNHGLFVFIQDYIYLFSIIVLIVLYLYTLYKENKR